MSMYRKNIFPCHYFHSRVEDNEALKRVLLPYVAQTLDDVKEPPDGWLTNNLKTSFENEEINKNFFTDNDMAKEVHRQYGNTLKTFFEQDYDAEIINLWYNCYENGEWQEAHRHMGDPLDPIHFAAVHFLSFNPKIHQPLVFNDPLMIYRAGGIDQTYCNEKYYVHAKEGDLIMFPSWMEHEVKPGPPTPDYPRITLSFNVRMHQYGDYGQNKSIR